MSPTGAFTGHLLSRDLQRAARLVPLVWENKRALFALLFEATAATLLEIARDPKRLGAETGFFSVLHTWNQKLQPNPHS
jgi:hypothetical protein